MRANPLSRAFLYHRLRLRGQLALLARHRVAWLFGVALTTLEAFGYALLASYASAILASGGPAHLLRSPAMHPTRHRPCARPAPDPSPAAFPGAGAQQLAVVHAHAGADRRGGQRPAGGAAGLPHRPPRRGAPHVRAGWLPRGPGHPGELRSQGQATGQAHARSRSEPGLPRDGAQLRRRGRVLYATNHSLGHLCNCCSWRCSSTVALPASTWPALCLPRSSSGAHGSGARKE